MLTLTQARILAGQMGYGNLLKMIVLQMSRIVKSSAVNHKWKLLTALAVFTFAPSPL